MYLLADINIKQFCNIPEEKCFAQLRILYSFIKSFVNPFVNISLTFSDSLYHSFWTKKKMFLRYDISNIFFAC